MKDIGEKVVLYDAVRMEKQAEKTEKRYSSVTVNADDFPTLEEKPIGEDCVVSMKVRVLNVGFPEYGSDEERKKKKIRLELRGMEVPPKQKNEYRPPSY